MKNEINPIEKQINLSRHADKVMSDMAPENVTDGDIDKMRKKVIESNPDIEYIDDEFLRHLALCDKEASIFGPKVNNKREKSTVSFSGIIRTQKEALEFTRSIDNLPEDAVVILGPSSSKSRCQETQWIYEQEVKYKAHQDKQLVILEDTGLISQDILDKKGIGRVVIINHEDADETGSEKINAWEPEYLDELKKIIDSETKDKETPIMKIWVALKNEIEQVKSELENDGIIDKGNLQKINSSSFDENDTPEKIAKDVISYIVQVLKTAQEKYPDRPVYYQGFSHNMIMDIASLKLLGHKISRNRLEELATKKDENYVASRPLEGCTLKLENNKIIFSFRDKEKEWKLDELEDMIKAGGSLDQEAIKRIEDWGNQ